MAEDQRGEELSANSSITQEVEVVRALAFNVELRDGSKAVEVHENVVVVHGFRVVFG